MESKPKHEFIYASYATYTYSSKIISKDIFSDSESRQWLLYKIECRVFHLGKLFLRFYLGTQNGSLFGAFQISSFHDKDAQPVVIVYSVFAVTYFSFCAFYPFSCPLHIWSSGVQSFLYFLMYKKRVFHVHLLMDLLSHCLIVDFEGIGW